MSVSIDHELAEDEHAVAAVDRRLDELAERDELARVLVAELAREAEQARIAGRLTQPREAREDLDAGSSRCPARSTSPMTCARTSLERRLL